MKNKENIKNIGTSKIKDNLWDDKKLEGKNNLKYCKVVINPNLENQNYLSALTSTKNKINITKITINSHELHSETGQWCIPKTPLDERVCHLYDTKTVEDENHFLLDCLALTHIHSNFQNLFHTSNLLDLLSQQNYGDIGMLFFLIFYHRNKMLKNPN